MSNPIDKIKTEAGKKLFSYMNKHWGSIVWGPVFHGILEIEAEAMKSCCNANVIHNVYPEGKEYPKEMLDPNIGGYWYKPKEETN